MKNKAFAFMFSLSFLRVKTQLLKRLQCVILVDGATHSQKDGVESNGGSLKGGAEAFMLPGSAVECPHCT